MSNDGSIIKNMDLSHIHLAVCKYLRTTIFDPPYLDYRTHQSEGVHWITHRIFEDNDHAPKSKIRSVKLSYRNMRFIKRHYSIYRKVLLWNRGTFLGYFRSMNIDV